MCRGRTEDHSVGPVDVEVWRRGIDLEFGREVLDPDHEGHHASGGPRCLRSREKPPRAFDQQLELDGSLDPSVTRLGITGQLVCQQHLRRTLDLGEQHAVDASGNGRLHVGCECGAGVDAHHQVQRGPRCSKRLGHLCQRGPRAVALGSRNAVLQIDNHRVRATACGMGDKGRFVGWDEELGTPAQRSLARCDPPLAHDSSPRATSADA